MSLQTIINDFIADAPPGELQEVTNNIKAIVDEPIKHELAAALETYNARGNVVLLNGKATIISQHTQSSTQKYVDFSTGKQFNVDVHTMQAIDVEDFDTDYRTADYELLEGKLATYLAQHYPSEAAFTVVPPGFGGEAYTIIINGWKHNPANFYNGSWCSLYTFDGSALRDIDVKLDIHYYEDGNVRLKSHLEPEAVSVGLQGVVTAISKVENDVELEIITKVNGLNETVFKNLRRLLPITRAKIQWGKAMGNYKLGKDVVNE
ncbi:hypothetical protein BABINDRAFT_166777 [Babjeviella inositovora NRRL Y-12698]|uniref:F-actin-capping protein subunit alpha n=1 Tax=Babjeviella inositovora NRRL Y-12698 TaxID=984486 RepID=A0A1E3QRV2_9ASCO|nr:uncharacterized protein BABINDRAFT_166777 [Babjeviella inositovora NRRL Y-12698]ODQ80446.1 hypothetical protein BABINDRAFT_166777 [Babjeviella inositovora NRRL Y-12698]